MGLFDTYKAAREEEKKKNPDHLATQGQLMLRILVGGYLYYLIYQLYTGGALKSTGWQLAAMAGGMVLFAVFGAYFIYNGVRALMRHEYYDPNSAAPEEAAEPPENAEKEQMAEDRAEEK